MPPPSESQRAGILQPAIRPRQHQAIAVPDAEPETYRAHPAACHPIQRARLDFQGARFQPLLAEPLDVSTPEAAPRAGRVGRNYNMRKNMVSNMEVAPTRGAETGRLSP